MSIFLAITRDMYTLKPGEVDEMRRQNSDDETDADECEQSSDEEGVTESNRGDNDRSKDDDVIKGDGEEYNDYEADYAFEGGDTSESDGEVGKSEIKLYNSAIIIILLELCLTIR